MNTNRVLTPEALALLLHLAPSTVRDHRWRRKVGLRATHVGGALRFLLEDVEGLLRRGREGLNDRDAHWLRDHGIAL